jgi:hypothetical protein
MTSTTLSTHGAVRRSRLVEEIGLPAVRQAVEAGEWLAPWPGVLVPSSRAADPLTVTGAAVLFAGEQAVVTGRTATWLHGCDAVDPLPVHLAVPYGSRLRTRADLVVHNGRRLSEDRVERADLPVLRLDRVLADLLCRDEPRSAFAVYDQALGRADDTVELREAVRLVIAERPDRRGARRAAVLVDLASGRPRSPAESRLQFCLVDLGFPNPELNLPIHDANGRLLFLLDLAWPGLRIAVEYDGHVAHLGREVADAERQRELERRGYLVIRVTAEDMKDVTRIEQELAAAFRARGLPLRRVPGVLQSRRHRERV